LLTRRSFLRGTLAATLAAACGSDRTDRVDGGNVDPVVPGPGDPDGGVPGGDPDAMPVSETCPDDPLAGGTLLGTVAILDSGSPSYGRLYDQGLDARLYTDLATIPDEPVTPPDMYYVRTATPDGLPGAGGWTVKVGGMVETAIEIPAGDLIGAAGPRGTYVMECSGNTTNVGLALISAGTWRGVKLAAVLDRVKPLPGATRILFSGYDRHDGPTETSLPGASWIFTRDELDRAGAFIATHLDGEPLSLEHGAPLRLYVPGWYGCVCIKWLNEIQLVADDAPATLQMREFAHRTMQDGEPDLARDYAPAKIEHSAMGVRVEKWQVGDRVRYRVWGILWGGVRPVSKLQVRFLPDETVHPVRICPQPRDNDTWALWSMVWDPPGAGTYTISCHIDDPDVSQRRLDVGHYNRTVKIS
jgi:DMSO/TMAO reductase YedYZ molybdopterin-dependent catalytic subunit